MSVALFIFVLAFLVALVGLSCFGIGIAYGAQKIVALNDLSVARRIELETQGFERRVRFETDQIRQREEIATAESTNRLNASIKAREQLLSIEATATAGNGKPLKN